jgi:hypothetical protein
MERGEEGKVKGRRLGLMDFLGVGSFLTKP